jgi:hypothetical protein
VHHDELQLVGGAIGQGLPVAVGAAVACPTRKVVNVQADGSAMYTIQSLWTMDREALDVCVVILDNGVYSILAVEHERMTGTAAGTKAASMFSLESRDGRFIDFVKLAEGQGVRAGRSETVGEFAALFKHAMATKGPFLIHAGTVHYTLYSILCTKGPFLIHAGTVHYTLYSILCTKGPFLIHAGTVHYTLSSILCTNGPFLIHAGTVHYTLYSILCTNGPFLIHAGTVHYTLYSILCTKGPFLIHTVLRSDAKSSRL